MQDHNIVLENVLRTWLLCH